MFTWLTITLLLLVLVVVVVLLLLLLLLIVAAVILWLIMAISSWAAKAAVAALVLRVQVLLAVSLASTIDDVDHVNRRSGRVRIVGGGVNRRSLTTGGEWNVFVGFAAGRIANLDEIEESKFVEGVALHSKQFWQMANEKQLMVH